MRCGVAGGERDAMCAQAGIDKDRLKQPVRRPPELQKLLSPMA